MFVGRREEDLLEQRGVRAYGKVSAHGDFEIAVTDTTPVVSPAPDPDGRIRFLSRMSGGKAIHGIRMEYSRTMEPSVSRARVRGQEIGRFWLWSTIDAS